MRPPTSGPKRAAPAELPRPGGWEGPAITEPYDKALDLCNRDIELDPNEYWAIGRRGRTFWQMRRYGKAVADITRLFKRVISNPPPENLQKIR